MKCIVLQFLLATIGVHFGMLDEICRNAPMQTVSDARTLCHWHDCFVSGDDTKVCLEWRYGSPRDFYCLPKNFPPPPETCWWICDGEQVSFGDGLAISGYWNHGIE